MIGYDTTLTELFGSVEDDRRESAGHLGVEANLDSRLYLVLTLDEQVEQLLGVDNCLSEVGHQADQRRVPLVDNLQRDDHCYTTLPPAYKRGVGVARSDLCEGCGAGRHEDLSDPVMEFSERLIVHPQETLRSSLFGDLILQVPDAVAVSELLVGTPTLG